MNTPILITSPKGLTSFLRGEVEKLGYRVTWEGSAGIQIEGTFTDAMKLNLYLRTAHHVLYLINEFTCRNPDDLYDAINRMPWETLIASFEYLSVVSNVVHPSIRDSRYANVKAKDAIVDRILSRKGKRPDSGPEKTGSVVHIYWRDERCMVYIDTSGEPLSKRGYRTNPLAAPMQETLAAAVVMATKWRPSEAFVNPMCGSGTIAIEAAMAGLNRAPGLIRSNFGFMHTQLYKRQVWDELKEVARSREIFDIPKIIATDISPEAIDASQSNAEKAGVDSFIDFQVADFEDTAIPENNGVIVFNPEYGMRLGEEGDLEETYKSIGTFLKHKCSGYRGYVFTANTLLAGKIGLKSGRKIPFQSGKIDCRLYEYSLYAGSRT
jgi:putative N6-adenine-specific DNA methylase